MAINRVLTDKDRKRYISTIEYMTIMCPEMMSRKIPEANVQQAFVFQEVQKLYSMDAKILCIGSFEDTACATLRAMGLRVTEIDPDVNGVDLETFFLTHPDKFDIIFSTSVIEHVKYDNSFIAQICYLLKENGIAILTCDFKDDYKDGDPLPATDIRFYTKYDLEVRLPKILEANDCELVGDTNYEGEPDFVYQGHRYSFATFVFRKGTNV